jgi:hypothetical protein
MSSNPMTRRGLLALLAALLAWCRGLPAAPLSAQTSPRNPARVYRTLFRFVTTVAGGRSTTQVQAICPTVEITESLPAQDTPASAIPNEAVPSGVTPPAVSFCSYDCSLPSSLTTSSEGNTTTLVYDSTSFTTEVGKVCTSVYDADGNFLYSVDGGDSSEGDCTFPEQEKPEVKVEYRYGITTFPE